MWALTTLICTQALLSVVALILTAWLPTVVVSDYEASPGDPRNECRRVLVHQRLSKITEGIKYNHDIFDKCAREHANQLLEQARRTRLVKENIRLDVRGRDLEPIERLYRVALLSIQPGAPRSTEEWVRRWARWWSAKHPKFPYDIRSEEDRFFAYVVERQLGFIRPTAEIKKFEADFNSDFISPAGFRPYEVTQPVRDPLLN